MGERKEGEEANVVVRDEKIMEIVENLLNTNVRPYNRDPFEPLLQDGGFNTHPEDWDDFNEVDAFAQKLLEDNGFVYVRPSPPLAPELTDVLGC